MGYFPFFVELSGEEGLIVGGGTVALRKVQKLLPYGPRLTVAAPELCPELRAIPGLTLVQEPFVPAMLSGKRFVISATGDRAENRRIAQLCRAQDILVNVVDDKEACTFLFPALVKKGELSIGISTGGASPTGAVYLKEQISRLVPDNFDELLAWLASLREPVKAVFPEERRRAEVFSRLFAASLERGRPLEGEELQKLLSPEERGR